MVLGAEFLLLTQFLSVGSPTVVNINQPLEMYYESSVFSLPSLQPKVKRESQGAWMAQSVGLRS